MAKHEPHILEYIDPAKLRADAVALPPAELAAAHEVNRRIAAGESLADIITFLFEATRGVTPCDRVSVAFLEDGGKRVVSHHAVALYGPLCLDKGYAADMRGSSLAAVLKTGRLRIIHDLDAYFKRKPSSESTRLLIEEGVCSSMTCPLVVEGRPVGFLFRSSRAPHSYTARHAMLHLAMAERISQAVEKAWRIEQLENANRAYTEMLGFVSHELKSPLASLIMDARLMTQGYVGALEPKQQESIERMAHKAEYLMNLVGEYLDYAHIESGQLKPSYEEVHFSEDIVEPAFELVRPQFEHQAMRIEKQFPAPEPLLECDPHLMKIVMANLLGNAVKYGYPKGLIRIKTEAAEGQLQVGVWNEGPGFPEDQRNKLFRKFSRIQKPELMKQKGTGVGLYTTWRIIEAHGGAIAAQSEEGRWAEFAFHIPLDRHEAAD